MNAARDRFGKTADDYMAEWEASKLTPPVKEPPGQVPELYRAEAANAPAIETPASESWNIVQSATAFAGKLIAREWRIKNVMPRGAELAVMYGDSGSGKSFLIDDMAAAVHLGKPWNGRTVARGRVIKICAEGAQDHRFRLHAQATAYGVALDALPAVIDNAPDLFNQKQALDAAQQIKAAGGCDVLLIDTLSATFSGNENGSDMNTYVRHVKLIQRALNCSVWIVHHSGKQAALGARGWSGLRAAVDVEIEVTREGEARSMYVSKQKGGSDGAVFAFKLAPVTLGTDAEGELYGSCTVECVKTEGKKRVRLTARQRQARDVMRKLSPTAERVPVDKVIAGILKAKAYTQSEVKSYHKRDARKTLNELRDLGQAWISNDGETCASSALIQSVDWLYAP